MELRHRALTPGVAGGYLEAARVCLGRHHGSPVGLELTDNDSLTPGQVTWNPPDDRLIGAWANTIDATEAGACCVVIAGLEALRGYYAVRRAETGTGADYYVGPPGAGENDLEDCWRLEISGMDKGSRKDLAERLGRKTLQAQVGASNLPALAGVFLFQLGILMLRDVPEKA
jgi:hypothetical protein